MPQKQTRKRTPGDLRSGYRVRLRAALLRALVPSGRRTVAAQFAAPFGEMRTKIQ